jgi:hypothetical protein
MSPKFPEINHGDRYKYDDGADSNHETLDMNQRLM